MLGFRDPRAEIMAESYERNENRHVVTSQMVELDQPHLLILKEVNSRLIKPPTRGRNSKMKQQAIIQAVSKRIWINV